MSNNHEAGSSSDPLPEDDEDLVRELELLNLANELEETELENTRAAQRYAETLNEINRENNAINVDLYNSRHTTDVSALPIELELRILKEALLGNSEQEVKDFNDNEKRKKLKKYLFELEDHATLRFFYGTEYGSWEESIIAHTELKDLRVMINKLKKEEREYKNTNDVRSFAREIIMRRIRNIIIQRDMQSRKQAKFEEKEQPKDK